MKRLFVFVVALAAVGAAQDECTPGEAIQKDCNTCICSGDGKTLFCTLMACPRDSLTSTEVEEPPPQLLCEPGTMYNDNCNVCLCGKDGKSRRCTEMECNSDVWNRDEKLNLVAKPRVARQAPKQICRPGQSFKSDCNTCFCSKDGTTASCTMMACPSISGYGNNYRGKREVLDSATSTTISNKICEPGASASLDGICNLCICNKEGTQTACTKNPCSSSLIKIFEEEEKWGPLYKQGDTCLPGKAFYSECNQCVCRADGRSAFCTLLACVT